MKLENGQWVMMAVKCIGKVCKNCPNLKVDTQLDEIIEDNGNSRTFVINLQCRSMNRCMRIYNMMEDDFKKWGASDDQCT